ncbi:MAG: hypothetical protein EB127_03450 [Alphaproteobacteria bacterium]|nr:hypothetical protein [Alphaproteobacteria bacterium]
MSFIKENDLIAADDVYTKSRLIKLRASGDFKEHEDWVLLESKSGRKAVWWTKSGYDRLMGIKDLKKQEEPVEKKLTAMVHQKFVNKKIVACNIEGWNSLQIVKVKDSTHLRKNSVIPVVLKKDGWVSIFKTDARGKISA